jgi:hypothetical protein
MNNESKYTLRYTIIQEYINEKCLESPCQWPMVTTFALCRARSMAKESGAVTHLAVPLPPRWSDSNSYSDSNKQLESLTCARTSGAFHLCLPERFVVIIIIFKCVSYREG